MKSFYESTASHFADWAFPAFTRDNKLTDVVAEHPDIPDKVRNAFLQWAESARTHFLAVQQQTQNEYGLSELETLRAEACYCIIHGQWQAALCLTNVLLELFLKLMLIYAKRDIPESKEPPLTRYMTSMSVATAKYMGKNLNETINMACGQELISKDAAEILHEYRARFRNAFFHADLQAMFGHQTTPVTGADFGTSEVEQDNIPIHSLPLIWGEAMWQNASANAIPYFIEVDGLIRETLTKVFPGIDEELSENMNE